MVAVNEYDASGFQLAQTLLQEIVWFSKYGIKYGNLSIPPSPLGRIPQLRGNISDCDTISSSMNIQGCEYQ
jgi:hypothetical protein